MSTRLWEAIAVILLCLSCFLAGMFINERHQASCPPCPPTVANIVSIDKIKRGSVGDIAQWVVAKPCSTITETVYLIPDSLYQYLPKGMQRRLKRRLERLPNR